MNFSWVATLILSGMASTVLANVAVLTKIQGSVRILKEPSVTVKGKGPHVLFEKKYYRETTAKRGGQLSNGEVVMVAADGKARLIFRNGDVISVDSDTAYKISWKDDSAPVIELLFGRLRAIFKKDGPRAGSKVRTKSMVLGVRGTDFFASFKGSSEVTVLRGEVELRGSKQKSKPVLVESGSSAKIALPSPQPNKKMDRKATPVAVVVRKTTKEQLVVVQKASTVVTKPSVSEGDTALTRKLEKLEVQASKNVLADIKTSDPALYAQIKTKKIALNLDQINTRAVGEVFKSAPKAQPSLKPQDSELEEIDEDAYEKYFKSE